ncbi:hypothetical protein ACE1CI_15140 [Aerosakkonemataceae cyanobacterium BLCC-F50]|uniref:Phage protein n=1 Tax=Floridaenema flaviceps BLCC-F50 TaxID=3153642 RepID=A0ABV4XTI6_9CYAN
MSEIETIVWFKIQQVQPKEKLAEGSLEKFMETFGAWENDRTDEELIKEIYESRSFYN